MRIRKFESEALNLEHSSEPTELIYCLGRARLFFFNGKVKTYTKIEYNENHVSTKPSTMVNSWPILFYHAPAPLPLYVILKQIQRHDHFISRYFRMYL